MQALARVVPPDLCSLARDPNPRRLFTGRVASPAGVLLGAVVGDAVGTRTTMLLPCLGHLPNGAFWAVSPSRRRFPAVGAVEDGAFGGAAGETGRAGVTGTERARRRPSLVLGRPKNISCFRPA
jgi:hypothetical protein